MKHQPVGILLSGKKWIKMSNRKEDREINEYLNKGKLLNLPLFFFHISEVDLLYETTDGILVENNEIKDLHNQKIPKAIYKTTILSKKKDIKKWRNLLLDKDYFVINEHQMIKRKHIIEMLKANEKFRKYIWEDKPFSIEEIKRRLLKNYSVYLVDSTNNSDDNYAFIRPMKGYFDPLLNIYANNVNKTYLLHEGLDKIQGLEKENNIFIANPLISSMVDWNKPINFYTGYLQKNADHHWEITAKYSKQGNKFFTGWDLLINQQFPSFNQTNKNKMIKNLENTMLRLIEYFTIYYPDIDEIGLQFVLNYAGHPFFHTVKSKQNMMRILKNLDISTWKHIITNPLELALSYYKREADKNE